MRVLLIHLLLLLGVGAGGAAAQELRTFELQHRSAEEIIPLLEPLLDEGVAFTGRGNTVLIRAPEATLDQAAEAIEGLDTRPAQLLITVRQGDSRAADRVDFGAKPREGVRVYSTEQLRKDTTVHQLRTLEDRWARIETGEQVPLPRQSAIATAGGVIVQQGIEYRQFGSGFEVRPRVNGDRVILALRPFRQQRADEDGGRYETQELVTTMEGALGEWIEIGGRRTNRRDAENTITYRTHERGETENRVRLKVELIQ